jgi:predicted transcriptional regulator
MKGKTISAYTDQETAELLNYLAKIEQRSPSQIAAIALKFFVKLPATARESWYQIETLGEQAQKEAVIEQITRSLINMQYEISQRKIVDQMNIETLEPLETEDDILAAALKLTDG